MNYSHEKQAKLMKTVQLSKSSRNGIAVDNSLKGERMHHISQLNRGNIRRRPFLVYHDVFWRSENL